MLPKPYKAKIIYQKIRTQPPTFSLQLASQFEEQPNQILLGLNLKKQKPL